MTFLGVFKLITQKFTFLNRKNPPFFFSFPFNAIVIFVCKQFVSIKAALSIEQIECSQHGTPPLFHLQQLHLTERRAGDNEHPGLGVRVKSSPSHT